MNDRHQPNLRDIRPLDDSTALELQYADAGIPAGFPSPAQEYMNEGLDLNREIVRHKETTFYARVCGDSMRDAGIFDGDLIVIDKLLEARDGDFVVACVDGEFTVKQYRRDPRHGCVWLMPANKEYKPIRITPTDDFVIWGVVTYTIRKLHR